MNKNEVKKIFRVFTIADYDKEEAFLREQHKNGYKFVRYGLPGFYYFEACEPEDVIYQLDFSNVSKAEKEDYLQLYKDTGWEYMFDAVGWSYFRKPASYDKTEDSIYTDKETKIELVERVFKTRMLPMLTLLFCCIIPQIVQWNIIWMNDAPDRMYALAFLIFFCSLFLLYLGIIIRCGRGLYRLKREYEEGK